MVLSRSWKLVHPFTCLKVLILLPSVHKYVQTYSIAEHGRCNRLIPVINVQTFEASILTVYLQKKKSLAYKNEFFSWQD